MTLIDTGPIVAYLSRNDEHHEWAVATINSLPAPFVSCEAVLTEALFLVSQTPAGPQRVFEMINRQALRLAFSAGEHLPEIEYLMAKYADLPISFADACLVRMSELLPNVPLLTTDSHFKTCRRNRREPIPFIIPN